MVEFGIVPLKNDSIAFLHQKSRSLASHARATKNVLLQTGSGQLSVTNILPLQGRGLSIDQYNSILEEFTNRYARKATEDLGAALELTSDRAELEDWSTPEAAAQLRRFSSTANRGTGFAHPKDYAKWAEFVLSAHRSQSKLEESMLRRWLHETEGWDEAMAEQLAGAYASGRSLLAFEKQSRRSA